MKVLQFSQHPATGPWDQTLIYDLFGDMNDNIVVIPGKDQEMYVDKVNEALHELPYAVVLVVSDEEAQFPYEQLNHPRIKVWVQYPRDSRTADRYIPGGYTPGTRDLKPVEKTIDYFFSGQITTPAREQMWEQLKNVKGIFQRTPGFTQGYPKDEYLDLMNHAKIVPCPHGAVTPDTLRLWEALELGCMPVIHASDHDFYTKILGGFPFPSVDNWADIQHLEYQDCRGWWNAHKNSMGKHMTEDLEWLKES
jgi:hypothetical protein